MINHPALPAVAIAAAVSACASAQDAPVAVEGPHGGAAIYSSEQRKESNDRWGYAATYRAGDFVFVSGVVASGPRDETVDAEGLKAAVVGAFERARIELEAAGSGLDEVVEIVTYHDWNNEHYTGTKIEHFRAVADAKSEMLPQPDPAWTAVGTTGLVSDRGLVELKLVAYSPAAN